MGTFRADSTVHTLEELVEVMGNVVRGRSKDGSLSGVGAYSKFKPASVSSSRDRDQGLPAFRREQKSGSSNML